VPRKQDYDKVHRLLGEVKKVLWTIALHDETNAENRTILENDRYYIADIIGNTMCADLLSYIGKDVDFTGIERKSGGYTIFNYMKLAKDSNGRRRLAIRLTKGGLRPDIVSAIHSILEVRYALTEQVIYHHAKCAASAMLAKIATLCGIIESTELYQIGDEGLMLLLEQKSRKLPEKSEDGSPLRSAVANLLMNLKARRLHKRVFRITESQRKEYDKNHQIGLVQKYGSVEARTELEHFVETALNLEPGSLILFCPSPKTALKEAKVMVTYDKVKEAMSNSTTNPVAVELRSAELAEDYPEISKRVLGLEEQYLSLWSFYGFLDPEKFGYAAGVKELLEREMGILSDPLFELYLNAKTEYQDSKRIEQAQAKRGTEARSRVYQGVLEMAARQDAEPTTETIDEDTLKRVVDAAYEQKATEVEASSSSSTEKAKKPQKKLIE